MTKHSTIGKIIFWLGFLFFMLGIGFNERVEIITNAPDLYTSLSTPAIIVGVVLLVLSNYFKSH
ncbi:hypothetical protein [Bacillus sp. FJAT-45350]|uniref:hypothetical protein n=1 Tax=Bacillus sp. FJAT-45350 TaxID=2011014 RepID=UPI000BB9BD68|nr:hypothetical protein [Bacillus sp. FJAT-45350]